MDRVIVYPGALPQTTDLLNTNKFELVAQAYQNRAILGANTVVAGLACTPTSPTADLHVTVGVGSIYQMDITDQAAYGDLGVDNTTIYKQGILPQPVVLTITPPVTAGQSQVYLIEAILNDVDAGQSVLSYYNSANPTSPYSGPANSGTSNFTTRTCPCVITLKAGTPATTGTQTTPAPDVGYVSLFAVTVANGQTQITSPNIVQIGSAPFFPTLPSVPANVQGGNWVYIGTDTGVANAYVVSFLAGQPIPTSYTAGMNVKFKALNSNSAILATPVNSGFTTATTGGTLAAATYFYRVSATNTSGESLASTETSQVTTGSTSTVTVNWGAVTGATGYRIYGRTTGAEQFIAAVTGVTTYVDIGTPAPSGALPGANTTTGPTSTVNVNGLGLVTIHRANGAGLGAGDIVSGQIVELTYDGVFFQMTNYLGTGTNTNTITLSTIPYVNDSGTTNHLIGTYSPAITSGQQVAGLFISIKLSNAITGACDINVNGLGVKNILLGDLTTPPGGTFVPGQILLMCYDGTEYQLMTGAVSAGLYHKPTSNQTLFVNGAIGNDGNDGVSNTVGHALATIQGGINKAYAIYAPSAFTITIVVEPGTYNENPSTPTYAGPNIIIDGLSAPSVIINGGAGVCLTCIGPNTMLARNLTIQNQAVYALHGFLATQGATLSTANTVSNTIGGAVFASYNGATVNPGAHTFSGNIFGAYWSIFNGSINLGSVVHTISTPISVGTSSGAAFGAWAMSSGNGALACNNTSPATFPNSGFASGPKFWVGAGGGIFANGLGINFFPGTVAGVIADPTGIANF
jgi:hypothetical protein